MPDYSRVFKDYDIRGVYPIEITTELAFKLGKALAHYFNGADIIVGRDCRIGSKELANELMRGITFQGANAIDISVCTTPMLYFSAKDKPAVMVTASHSPKEFNGFKICKKGPIVLATGALGVLQTLTENNEFPKPKKRGSIKKKNINTSYLNHLKKFKKKIKKTLKVVVDAGNGTAGSLAKKVFPCKIIPLFFEPNGDFPNRDPNPLAKDALTKLKSAVKKNKANLGIAYDGDADRVIFVDEKADIIPADFIGILLAKYLLDKHPNSKILYDATCSRTIKKEITKLGGIAIMTRIGHTYVSDLMKQEDALFGCEMSGHYYFKDNFYVDSADIAALLLLQVLSKGKKSLSRLTVPFKKTFRFEIDMQIENKLELIEKIEHHYYKDSAKIFHIDGLTVEFDKWWFNIRPSHTEPVVRLKIEADTKALLDRKKSELLKLIKR